MAGVIPIPLHPLQPRKAGNTGVGCVFILNMFLSLCLSVYPDPMGEEHHIRRTSGVPPLLVVVSVFVSNDSSYIPLHAVFFIPSLTVLNKMIVLSPSPPASIHPHLINCPQKLFLRLHFANCNART